ncbi:tetratricopeptide repeat protein [Wenzhouxiangella sp. XN24]|uniref:tetratricopeptide repeat protein n=1 Tax=Wenzhouxiangella sp. XN24 TaxID=2713569 RepID=UPI0013EBEC7E|nr:tetratricopeptide repeat protein [Wenzhouxiangella sp. XN24]NGX16576.1 tetratricopeptide repeat protein [Wenzhouxiangella sp. XN24]
MRSLSVFFIVATFWLCAESHSSELASWIEFSDAYHADELDRALASRDRIEPDRVFIAALADYRLAGMHMMRGDEDNAARRLRQALSIIESESHRVTSDADLMALRGGIEGMLIGTGGFLKGMRLGPRSARAIQFALTLDPSSATAWYMEGVGLYWRPRIFGGSNSLALDALDRAIELFGQSADDPVAGWGLAEAHVWCGEILYKEGKYESAARAFSAALAVQPGYRRAEAGMNLILARTPDIAESL